MRNRGKKVLFSVVAVMVVLSFVLSACAAATPTSTPAPPTATKAPAVVAPTPTAVPGAPTTPTKAPATATSAPIPASPTPKGVVPKGKVVVVMDYEPENMEPGWSPSSAINKVLFNVLDRVVERDPKTQQLRPMIAEKWEQTAPNTWRFYIRKGVKFQDNTNLNAEVVAWNINRLNNRDNPDMHVQGFFGSLKEAKVVDEYTFDLLSGDSDPIIPLRALWMPISSKKFLQEQVELTGTTAVGSGPYKIVEFVRGQYVKVAANTEYWGQSPEVKDVVYMWRQENSVRAAMVRTGEAQIAFRISPEDAKMIQPPLKLKQEASNEICFLRLDTIPGLNSNPWMMDRDFRKAVALAIDKESIAEYIIGGAPAAQPWPSFAVGYDPNEEPYPYDPEQSKRLLAQVGYDGTEVTYVSSAGKFTRDTEMGESIVTMLADVGINSKMQAFESVKWREQLYATKPDQKHPDILNNCTSNEFGDASGFIRYALTGGAVGTYASADFDALYNKAMTLSGDERSEMFKKAWDVMREDYYAITLAHLPQICATSAEIEWTPRVDLFFKLDEVKWAK